MHHTYQTNIISELDLLIKDVEDIDIVGLYQDEDHAVELSHKDGIFFVRLDGANLYTGEDGTEATSTFYEQIAQIEDDAKHQRDPSFAALREILQSRNDHVREMLAAIGHERLASSLDGIELTKEFNMDSFRNIIQKNMTTLDVLNFANYRPSEEENKECHTCIFFAAGGYCTKLDLPVKEEMMCDFFKSLPMAEKNEEWAHVSHQSWEEAEHEEEHEHGGDVQKDVSTDLIYSTDSDLESPANFREDSRKPNIIMREFIPENGNKGFQVLAKSDDDSITEVQLINNDGNWGVFTKQRDYSDLGDPFQSVGEPYSPKKVKNEEEPKFIYDEEGNAVKVDENGEIEKLGPLAAIALPLLGTAAASAIPAAIGSVVDGVGSVIGDALAVGEEASKSEDLDRKPNVPQGTTVPKRIKDQQDQHRNLDYSEIDEGRVEKQSNEGGLGVDDPEAPNDGTMASSQHYRRVKEDEENKKASLAMKAYANDGKKAQEPIDPDADGREALSSAEAGNATQSFSSGAVIDMPDEALNSKASGGAGGEGVEGGGDGSVAMIAPQDATESDLDSDYDSELRPIRPTPVIKEGGGGGGGAGGGAGAGAGAGGFGGDGGGGGTAMTAGGSSGSDPSHTDTYGGGRAGKIKRYDSSLKMLKDSMDAGSYEGVSQLPYPQDDDSRPRRTVERHKPGDSEDGEDRASDDEHEIPREQQPIGDGYASSYVIADDDEEHESRYSPTAITQKPEHELVSRKFIDEDNRLRSINDNAAEQYTNLSMVSQDLQTHFVRSDDNPETLLNNEAFRVLTSNSIKKMDTGRTLVVAGWGNYYIVDREGHRLGLEGMRRALAKFLAKKEFANMNIFHSGIQVGQVLRKFTDQNGKEWRTEVRPQGLFVVCAFRTDLEVSRKAMAEVLRGAMRGFSIAGNAKSKEIKCDHGNCWTEVNDLEIYEMTLCVAPMNPKSYITDIVQKPDP